MIRVDHLREHVIRPALRSISVSRPMDAPAAIELLVGTYLAESRVGGNTALVQMKGPALGIWQMEPPTYMWLRSRGWTFEHTLGAKDPQRLIYDLRHAAIMARLRYWVAPDPLPAADDIAGLAGYWKRVYNTHLGAGDPAKFVELYNQHGRTR